MESVSEKDYQLDKKTITLINSNSRDYAKREIDRASDGHVCIIQEPTRSQIQNARLWAMLTDVSRQIDWYGKKLSPEDWKHLFTSSLRKLEVVPNLEGSGFVALGLSTSKMSVKEMCDLQTLIEAFGAEHNVRWSAPSYYQEN